MGEMSKFLAVGYDFSPPPGLLIKVQEKGEESKPGGCNSFGKFFYKKGDAWHMILGDNLAGQVLY